MKINGNLFRNEELTLMLLSQILETWQKMLRNPWAQLLSAGHLWPHKISSLFLPYIYLNLVRLCLGARRFQRWGHKVLPLGLSEQVICPSCLIGLLFCWVFLLSEMMTFLTAHSSAAAAPASPSRNTASIVITLWKITHIFQFYIVFEVEVLSAARVIKNLMLKGYFNA